jgi:hypothetical protein
MSVIISNLLLYHLSWHSLRLPIRGDQMSVPILRRAQPRSRSLRVATLVQCVETLVELIEAVGAQHRVI